MDGIALAVAIIDLAIKLEPTAARIVEQIMAVMADESTTVEEKRARLESYKQGFEEMLPKE